MIKLINFNDVWNYRNFKTASTIAYEAGSREFKRTNTQGIKMIEEGATAAQKTAFAC
jgi:hypothetical protein